MASLSGYTYSSTSSATNSTWASGSTHYVKMDLEDQYLLKPKQNKKEEKMQSKLVQKLLNDIGINMGRSVECVHAPKTSADSNIYVKDIVTLQKQGYVVNLYPFEPDNNKNRIEYGCGAVFLINILEFLPNIMAQALALKECIGYMDGSNHSIIVVSSRTKEDLKKEAEDKKYKKKDDGFLIEVPGKKPLYAEGIHKDHIANLFKYINQTKLYDNKSENCVAAVVRP